MSKRISRTSEYKRKGYQAGGKEEPMAMGISDEQKRLLRNRARVAGRLEPRFPGTERGSGQRSMSEPGPYAELGTGSQSSSSVPRLAGVGGRESRMNMTVTKLLEHPQLTDAEMKRKVDERESKTKRRGDESESKNKRQKETPEIEEEFQFLIPETRETSAAEREERREKMKSILEKNAAVTHAAQRAAMTKKKKSKKKKKKSKKSR